MNKVLLLSLITTLSFSSCSESPLFGSLSSDFKNVGAYTQINVSSGTNITITEGEPGDIIITAYESILEDVDAYVSGEVLHISYSKGIGFWEASSEINVSIPANNLSKIEASGGSNVKVTENNKVFNSSAVSINLSGGAFEGDIDVKIIDTVSIDLSGESTYKGVIDVKNLVVTSSGGSDIEITGGAVETLTADVSYGGKFNGRKFTTATLSTELSVRSNMWINIKKQITRAKLSNGSNLYYTGDIVITGLETSSGSDIKHENSF